MSPRKRDRQPQADQPFVPADPRMRAITLSVSVAIVVVGAGLLWWLKGYEKTLMELAEVDRPAAVAKVLLLTDAVAVAGEIGLLAAGLWCAALARRVARSEQFPPPGMKVIRNTPLRTGKKAKTMAMVAGLLAAVLILGGSAGMWMLHATAHALLRS